MARSRTRPLRRLARLAVTGALAVPGVLGGCRTALPAAPAPASPEAITAAHMAELRRQPLQLQLFLREMPKGADLHNHLGGAVYAESYLRWAAEDSLCVSAATLVLVPPPCDGTAHVPAAAALQNARLYGDVVDAWSMRNWHAARQNGHDQFFETFGKFGLAAVRRLGDMLAEVVARAAAQRVSYLELMVTPDSGRVVRLGRAARWDPDLRRLRERLLAAGLRDSLARASGALDRAEARQRELLRCHTPQPDPGCHVVVRYLYQVGRAGPPEQVFAQILAGFELTRRDPRVVGFNLVQPEDDPVPMGDFTLHMAMIDFLHRLYPDVPITLHAGELAEGLVPREGLRSHIRTSVRQGHARRIGHGVSVIHEDDPLDLLREMAERRVLVEIALSSNDVILSVRGAHHPLATYLRYGVPVALVTDDEGVLRSDLTREFRRAVEEQGVDYPTLKRMVRNSLQHAFVEGESLWQDTRAFTPVADCSTARGGLSGATCGALVGANLKARLQWELELAFQSFEAGVATTVRVQRADRR
jgi:adenosine deaminase